ncbi:hypothetical protein FQN54_000580 [Arachnomyces sp. PD_36]|nr:hypothetical protein FQN54_000580 [Arachnomyces sp. PD_36]
MTCYRQLISHYDTRKLPSVEIRGRQSTKKILSDVQSSKIDYKVQYKSYRPTKGIESEAYDTVSKPLYLNFFGELYNETNNSAKPFDTQLRIEHGLWNGVYGLALPALWR